MPYHSKWYNESFPEEITLLRRLFTDFTIFWVILQILHFNNYIYILILLKLATKFTPCFVASHDLVLALFKRACRFIYNTTHKTKNSVFLWWLKTTDTMCKTVHNHHWTAYWMSILYCQLFIYRCICRPTFILPCHYIYMHKISFCIKTYLLGENMT